MAIAQVTGGTAVLSGGTSVSMGAAANTVAFLVLNVAPGPSTQIPTINGVNMTAFGSPLTWNGVRVGQWFYMINPPTGSQTVDPKNSGNFDGATVIVFSGVHQTTPIDSSGSATNQASPMTLTTTVVAANCWLVGGGYVDTGGANTAGGSFDNTTLSSTSPAIAHSNGVVATGSRSGTFTHAAAQWGGIVLSIAPAVAAFVEEGLFSKMVSPVRFFRPTVIQKI